jgi:hypothetical protein
MVLTEELYERMRCAIDEVVEAEDHLRCYEHLLGLPEGDSSPWARRSLPGISVSMLYDYQCIRGS